jgi:hypothetical protein
MSRTTCHQRKTGPEQQPSTVDSPLLDSCLFCSIQGLKRCNCACLSSFTTTSEQSSLSVNGESDNSDKEEPVMDTEDFNNHCIQLATRMLLKSALGPRRVSGRSRQHFSVNPELQDRRNMSVPHSQSKLGYRS